MAIVFFPMSVGAKRRKQQGRLRWVLADNLRRRLEAYRPGAAITNTQKEIAAKANLSVSTLQRICSAEHGASLDNIEALAEALSTSVVELLTPAPETLRSMNVTQFRAPHQKIKP